MNGKACSDNSLLIYVMGKHGFVDRNKNGEKFVDFINVYCLFVVHIRALGLTWRQLGFAGVSVYYKRHLDIDLERNLRFMIAYSQALSLAGGESVGFSNSIGVVQQWENL